jgi:alpha-glucuronidase
MKVGNRLKQGTRDQRIQDRHARLVAQVNQLQDDNARLQKQVDSNKAARE